MNIQLAAAERLEYAVAVIRKEGWIQKLIFDHNGVCAVGALIRVQLGRAFRPGDSIGLCAEQFLDVAMSLTPCIYPDRVSLKAAEEILRLTYPSLPVCHDDLLINRLERWNDRSERTRDEVIAAMLTAATLLRAKAVPETGTCTAIATHFEFPELEWKL